MLLTPRGSLRYTCGPVIPTLRFPITAAPRMSAPTAELAVDLVPAQISVLYISGPQRTGAWLAEAFASDSACQVRLVEVPDVAEGLAALRDEQYDAVLVSHEGIHRDALQVLDAIRAGTTETQPVIVLGSEREADFSDLCYESGGDAYVCVDTTTTRGLLWKIAFARQRHLLIAENRRLRQAQRYQLAREHDEANRLLEQQREMLGKLETLYSTTPRRSPSGPLSALPDMLVQHYRELLRAYVIMGSGSLLDQMNQLAELLAGADVSPHQALRLHLAVLEELIKGLGSRSARHVMSRADMLILEMILKLAEVYRQRARRAPARRLRQLRLPGFE